MTGSILIIARNNLHLTKKAVASALDQDLPCDVTVIDNGSTDGTCQWLRSKSHICGITLLNQISLSACWNMGLDFYWAQDKPEVLVLNNDVEIRRDTYRRLLEVIGLFVTGVSVRTRDKRDIPLVGVPKVSPHPDFSCFMIHKKCWDRVGKFNEYYFPAYCEDAEYHVRMHRAGVTAGSINVPFLHHASQTIKHCSPAERLVIERGADHNRQMFKAAYGCLPGTEEYQKLFT